MWPHQRAERGAINNIMDLAGCGLQGSMGGALRPRALKRGQCRACRGSGLLVCKRCNGSGYSKRM
jgi:hypothetical protein